MATNFIDYLKNLYSSMQGSKSNSSANGGNSYNDERKELEDYLNSSSALPKKETLPDVPKYDRVEVEDVSDEKMAENAKDSLKEYENSSKNAIESELESLRKKYEKDKLATTVSAENKKAETEKAYNNALVDTSNDSLKRGLARSSIAVNKQADLNEAKASEIVNIVSSLNDNISALDGEISGLSVKREKALNDFNISYASKLTETINNLKTELDDKKKEALKYNNSLTEKEYSSRIDKTMKESDLYGDALSQKEKEYDVSQYKNTNFEKSYDLMYNMLSKMSAAEAKTLVVSDSIFKDNLSDYYYYKLLDQFGRK